MSFEVLPTLRFVRELKRLGKKYRSLKADVDRLGERLADNPTLGTPLGDDLYKVRLAIRSKGRGRSGGARVITLVLVVRREVHLLTLFDKNEQGSITDKELRALVKQVPR